VIKLYIQAGQFFRNISHKLYVDYQTKEYTMTTRDDYKVLVTDYVWPSTEPERKVLSEIGATIVEAPDQNEDTLIALASDADAIMTCFAQVTAAVVRAAKDCVVISRYGVGVDNIAVDVATDLGIPVTYVPDYCVDEVSDHVMALLLAWNRQVLFYDQIAKRGEWSGTPAPVPLERLRGKNLGVLGLGRIGLSVSAKAKSFGLNVLGYDPYMSDNSVVPAYISISGFDELLAESDYITVHTPLNNSTVGLISDREFGIMKPSAYLINCARGPIVDQLALYKALESNSIRGAGLDVMDQSEPSRCDPMFSLDNVIITPHVAFLSKDSVYELEVRTAQATKDVIQGRMPEFLVNPDVLTRSRIKLL
jgi:D-3-phosphoglycerate dehydrogenase